MYILESACHVSPKARGILNRIMLNSQNHISSSVCVYVLDHIFQPNRPFVQHCTLLDHWGTSEAGRCLSMEVREASGFLPLAV